MIFLSKVKILKNLKNSSRTQYISIHLKKQYLAYKQQHKSIKKKNITHGLKRKNKKGSKRNFL